MVCGVMYKRSSLSIAGMNASKYFARQDSWLQAILHLPLQACLDGLCLAGQPALIIGSGRVKGTTTLEEAVDIQRRSQQEHNPLPRQERITSAIHPLYRGNTSASRDDQPIASPTIFILHFGQVEDEAYLSVRALFSNSQQTLRAYLSHWRSHAWTRTSQAGSQGGAENVAI